LSVCALRNTPPLVYPQLMSDVTQLLNAIDRGDAHAAAKLLPLIYDELRRLAAQKLAHETPGQTLEATALVHEAYLRLVGAVDANRWNDRGRTNATPGTRCGTTSTPYWRRRER
jgi:hypothetical protein